MAKHNISLAFVNVLSVIFFIVTMVFTALAGPGTSPFLSTTGNISDEFVTEITPSGWTFVIWSIIYAFLALALVFNFACLFRTNVYGYVYCSPAILPHGFYVTLCLNLSLNVAWLFLWDRKYMIPALVFLILIALTNYAEIFFACHGVFNYEAWLCKYHKIDLVLHRVLIQNGIAIYATWTTIASHVNLNIVLTYNASMTQTDASTVALSVLAVVLIVWFILENTILHKYVKFILTIYPVAIWALTGVFTNNYNAAAPTRNNIFVAVLLAVACALCALRILLFVWRQRKKMSSREFTSDAMSPMEIAERQKKIFK